MMYKATDLSKMNTKNWRKISDDDGDKLIYRFVADRYHHTPTLIGQITVDMDNKKVSTDVMWAHNNAAYQPYYWEEYGDSTPMLEKLESRFNFEFKKFGIVKIGKKKHAKHNNE